MANGHLVALVAAPRAHGLAEASQLVGRKVGVTTLGSATHLWLDFWLTTRRIDAKQITPIAISTAGRAVAALEAGTVDAGVVSDFTVRTLEQRFGKVTVLADSRTPETARAFYGVSQYPGTALFARRAWIAAHAPEVRAVVCAVTRAREWVTAHRAEEVVARLSADQRGPDLALYTEVIRGTIAMLTPDGRITEEGAQAAQRVAGTERSARDSYTNEFVP